LNKSQHVVLVSIKNFTVIKELAQGGYLYNAFFNDSVLTDAIFLIFISHSLHKPTSHSGLFSSYSVVERHSILLNRKITD